MPEDLQGIGCETAIHVYSYVIGQEDSYKQAAFRMTDYLNDITQQFRDTDVTKASSRQKILRR